MASYFNIFGGILTFIAACTLTYGLWNPAMDFINYFPTELFVIAGGMWVTINFFSIVYMPFIMFVSDDTGN